MVAKILAFIVNLGLASVLVVLSTNSFAQEDPVSESAELTVKLTGTAVVQKIGSLSVSPAVVDFGNVTTGESHSANVSLSHTGAAGSPAIAINEVELFGDASGAFSIDFAGFITLQPGQTQNVSINFSPVDSGSTSAGVRLSIAQASAPHIIMLRGESTLALSSQLLGDQTDLDLGEVDIPKATSENLVLSNDASDPNAPVINIQSINISGDNPEAFSHNFSPTTLAPGESTTVAVQMQSAQEGFKSAQLTVAHDGNNNALSIDLAGEVIEPSAIPVNFSVSELNGATITRGTSIQFGPDGKLYVSQGDGKILVFSAQRNAADNYSATLLETINSIYNVPNHNDMGELEPAVVGRQVTGILVTGTATNPVIYAQSSDPRHGAGPSGVDNNLDTNSGMLHKLEKNGNNWNHFDLVRGLPRSEENHAGNGLVIKDGKLLGMNGGHTNMGAPSNNFARTAEYALSGALLEYDLAALGNGTYDLPTLDDEERAGVNDANDPFGGNNGKNQAILEANGPVKIYAPGFRNAYDLVLTESNRLYTFDNGPNAGWGNTPLGNCSNDISEGGNTYRDALHNITNRGYFGGHPNPTRGNKSNTFNASNPQTPIEGSANPLECNYLVPVEQDGALTIFTSSSNGMDEYTASNFGGAMKGDLLVARFQKVISRLRLNASGTKVMSKSSLKSNIGAVPLDLTALGDSDPFPGTIWIVDYTATGITVLEPSDY